MGWTTGVQFLVGAGLSPLPQIPNNLRSKAECEAVHSPTSNDKVKNVLSINYTPCICFITCLHTVELCLHYGCVETNKHK